MLILYRVQCVLVLLSREVQCAHDSDLQFCSRATRDSFLFAYRNYQAGQVTTGKSQQALPIISNPSCYAVPFLCVSY